MMKKFSVKVALTIVVFFLCLPLCFAGNPKSGPFLPDIPDVWTKMYPDSDFTYNGLKPACSNCPASSSDEFYYYAKRGSVNNLVIFFDGGGACWSSVNCLYYTTYSYEMDAVEDNPENFGGIFDTTNPLNPFKDWSFVFIPYCTGDIHWGAADTNYIDYLGIYGGGEITIQHRGFVNFQAVLEWLTETFRRPHKIFVTGSSAGSYGAILAFPYINDAFPKSKAYVLGDAGNGVVDEGFKNIYINNWNVQIPEWVFGPSWSFSDSSVAEMYSTIADYYPKTKVAQYTTAGDSTQIWFYNVMLQITDNPLSFPPDWVNFDNITPAVWCDWYGQMLGFADETAQSPNYRYYIGAGGDHTIMAYPKFYEEESAGIPFVEWVNAMVKSQGGRHGHGGIPWVNTECDDCDLLVACPF
jgi:hypothetical protein